MKTNSNLERAGNMENETYEELNFEVSTYTVNDAHVYHVSTLDGEIIAVIDKKEDWGFDYEL